MSALDNSIILHFSPKAKPDRIGDYLRSVFDTIHTVIMCFSAVYKQNAPTGSFRFIGPCITGNTLWPRNAALIRGNRISGYIRAIRNTVNSHTST